MMSSDQWLIKLEHGVTFIRSSQKVIIIPHCNSDVTVIYDLDTDYIILLY